MSNVFTYNVRTVHSTKTVNVRPWTATNTAEGLADVVLLGQVEIQREPMNKGHYVPSRLTFIFSIVRELKIYPIF